MKITYDKEANAAYIYMGETTNIKVYKTYCCDSKEINGMINLDFDRRGRLLGIEIMEADKILQKCHLNGADSS